MATDWTGEMDPAERLDFLMDFAGGDTPVLASGETITGFSLAVTAAAAALGLTIETVGSYAAALVNGATAIRLWLSVAAGQQANSAFTAGAKLGVVATFQTSSAPVRTRERTFNVSVRQL